MVFRLLFLSALSLDSLPVFAHTVGVSRGEYRASGGTLTADLVFARPELTASLGRLDAEALITALEVRSTSGTCRGRLLGTAPTDQDGIAVHLSYACDEAPGAFTVRLALLRSLSLGHRHLAAVTTASGTETRVLYESNPTLRFAPGKERSREGVAWPLFRLGVQHILTGYDHLLFLFGVVLVGSRLRPLLVVITTFTAAHSITLGLAVLGMWAPSPRLVEPAIALSIAYVGVENLFVRDASRRWLITFPFGLVHGFGFAGALRAIALPAGQLPLALASFNVGVEAGQLAVLATVLPVLLWLGQQPWFARAGVRAVSLAITIAGLYWFFVGLA
jgi:hydrogenase/urease accessory protein HupE